VVNIYLNLDIGWANLFFLFLSLAGDLATPIAIIATPRLSRIFDNSNQKSKTIIPLFSMRSAGESRDKIVISKVGRENNARH